MRLLLCLLLFFAISQCPFAQPELSRLAAARKSGEQQEVLTIIDSLQVSGRLSPDLYLLQGNTYYELGQLGHAVLAYERGLRLRPTHAALRNNLAFVEQQLPLVFPATPEFFLVRWWKITASFLGVQAAQWLAILAWWLAMALFIWWFFKRQTLSESRRFLLLPAAISCMLLAVLAYNLGQSRVALLQQQDQAVLLAPNSVLRVAPGEKASLEREVTAGLRLRIVDDSQEKYLKVQLRNGLQGWLPRADVAII